MTHNIQFLWETNWSQVQLDTVCSWSLEVMDCFINVLRPGCSIAGEKLPHFVPIHDPNQGIRLLGGTFTQFYPSLRILLKHVEAAP